VDDQPPWRNGTIAVTVIGVGGEDTLPVFCGLKRQLRLDKTFSGRRGGPRQRGGDGVHNSIVRAGPWGDWGGERKTRCPREVFAEIAAVVALAALSIRPKA